MVIVYIYIYISLVGERETDVRERDETTLLPVPEQLSVWHSFSLSVWQSCSLFGCSCTEHLPTYC